MIDFYCLMWKSFSLPQFAGDILQNTFSGIPGIYFFLDDIKIQGFAIEKDLDRSNKVLTSLQGLNVKEDKCIF